MITSETFGNNGRLGNQLFQYASLIGIAKNNNRALVLPAWEYAHCFEGEFPEGQASGIQFKESTFTYNAAWTNFDERFKIIDIFGYLQTEKYWQHCVSDVRQALTFKDEFKAQSRAQFSGKAIFNKPTIAISIRRGDYVNNPNYEQLPITYFILALFENFPNWKEHNIIIFSDDIPYCKVHFDCLPNVFFSTNNSAIEDICLMSQCSHFILSNSTFSWWGAYLGECKDSKIVRPNYLFNGKLLAQNDWSDFYPERWTIFDHKKSDGTIKKIDLSDTSFTIPVSFDHNDRKENLDLCIRILQKNFDCEIIVAEQGTPNFKYVSEWSYYIHYHDMTVFHRTKMLNNMAKATDKSIVFNWDADVIIAPLQIWMCVEKIRNGADMVYPYDGQFARMPRNLWFVKIRDYEDIGMVGDKKFNGMNNNDAVSVGGAVAFNKQSFISGGMENEKFISFGAEDVERMIRFEKLGFKIERVPGPLYHMNHFVGVDSSVRNPYFMANKAECEKVATLKKETLEGYVATWPWNK